MPKGNRAMAIPAYRRKEEDMTRYHSPHIENWKELSPGVYIHCSLSRLLIIREEICKAMNIPDDMSDDEWYQVAELLWRGCVERYSEVVSAGIGFTDVIVSRRTPHAN